jgi:TrmH family RNA methyltransferase
VADITSPTNDRIKALVRLWDHRERDATGAFLIEGARELQRAQAAGVEIDEQFTCPELGAVAAGTTLSRRAFEKVSRRQNPDGVLAIARQWSTDLSGLELSANPLVLVAEAIEKPGNLGALLRVADGAGVDAVVVCDGVVDVFNPNVIRASQGSLFSVPIAVAGSDEVLRWLAQAGIGVVATFPDADLRYSDADLTAPTAVVVGAEATGLSEQWRHIGTAVSIPMAAAADSLNAAVTAAIVAYEAVRQRAA